MLLVHQFQNTMIVDKEKLDPAVPEVALTLSVDGFGSPYAKITKFSTWSTAARLCSVQALLRLRRAAADGDPGAGRGAGAGQIRDRHDAEYDHLSVAAMGTQVRAIAWV